LFLFHVYFKLKNFLKNAEIILSKENSKMLAVSVKGGQKAIEVDRPVGQIVEDCIIKVNRVGICGTDLALFDGYADFDGIVGHEFSGTVVECDQYTWLRRRVTASINMPATIKGDVNWKTAKHDPNRRAIGIRGINGAMAEYICLPEGVLVALPDNVSDAEAAMAEPLAAAMDAVDKLPISDEPILLIGDGKLAQLIARVLIYRDKKVHVIGKSSKKLDLLTAIGAEVKNQVPSNIKYDRIIEATGVPEGLSSALENIRPTGTIVLKSTFNQRVDIEISRLVVNEIKLIGSRCGNVSAAVKLLSDSAIEVNDLISDTFELKDADKAFKRAREDDSLKVQLVC
jgi:2-desacetyl-2-hydroxyethyl bacteriochlorophyllide A dehydrogenase